MRNLIIGTAIGLAVGGTVGYIAAPDGPSDSCFLALVKADQLMGLAGETITATSDRNATQTRVLANEINSVLPVYGNLRTACLSGD